MNDYRKKIMNSDRAQEILRKKGERAYIDHIEKETALAEARRTEILSIVVLIVSAMAFVGDFFK